MAEHPSHPDSSSSALELLEIEKRRLECDKLRAEIAEVSVAWWQRPGYIGGIAPILIAVVGFLSVWSTGFFDTQRATLRSEVENLKVQETALQERAGELARANAEIQQRIDDAYIRLKLASSDARYALSHLQGLGLHISDGDRKRVEASLTDVPPGVSALVRDLLDRDQLAGEIVPITEEELKGLASSLDAIPASTWATELEPTIGRVPALRAPDGRIYNPADRKFYEKEEDLPR
jgi:hypothetical protein